MKVDGRLATNVDLNCDLTTLCVNGNLILELWNCVILGLLHLEAGTTSTFMRRIDDARAL